MKTKNFFKRKTTGQIIVYTIAFAIMLVQCLSLIFCLCWGFSSSLKTQEEFSLNSPLALPEQWVFVNYLEAFEMLEVRGFNFLG